MSPGEKRERRGPMRLNPESIARASSRHPWRTFGAWLVILVGSFTLVSAGLFNDALTNGIDFTNNPESKEAAQLVEDRLRGGPEPDTELVLVTSETATVDDPAFAEYVGAIQAEVDALDDSVVTHVGSYLTEDGEVSEDGDSALLPVLMTHTDEDVLSDDAVLLDEAVRSVEAPEGFETYLVGPATVFNEFQEVIEEDIVKGETIGVVVALVVLLVVLGAVVAGIVPILLAAFAIGTAMGLTALAGLVFDFSFFVQNMITMVGLAVGIDYSLFIIARYREERLHGRDKLEAIAHAGGTASRAVFFSGMTVVIALLGLLIVPTTIFGALAAGAIFVVIGAVAAALTLLPALLAVLGDKVNALRVRRNAGRVEAGTGFWDWASRLVMRRPVISLLAAGGLLVVLALPYFSIHTGTSGVSTLPDDLEAKQAFVLLEDNFAGGLTDPAQVVIDGDIASPEVQAAIAELESTVGADDRFGPPGELLPNEAGDLALLPIPFGVGLSFLLLTVVFRSIVLPVKAIILNLLSVGAAYGLVVAFFQQGVGPGFVKDIADALNFQQVESIEAWIPLFLFAILFGLSMDYHVFLLTRIRERFDFTRDNAGSVTYGLRSTGGLITGCALIMVAVFAGFAAGRLAPMQQMGVRLAVAVFPDATIVRSILVPSSMKLLGNLNWYLPKWLEWLPQLRVEGHEAEQVAEPVEPEREPVTVGEARKERSTER